MKLKIFSILLLCLCLMVSSPAYNAPVTNTVNTTILNNQFDAIISVTLAKSVTIDDILIDLVDQGYVVSQNALQGNTYILSFTGTKAELIGVLNYIANNGGTITKLKIEK